MSSEEDRVWDRIQIKVENTPEHSLRNALKQALWDLHLTKDRCLRECQKELKESEQEIKELEWELTNKNTPNDEVSFELLRISDLVRELRLDLQRLKEAPDVWYKEYLSSCVEDGFKNLNQLIDSWYKSL